ncbi:ankyrin repeat domain-containing protein, partial [Skeletonema marinoi]
GRTPLHWASRNGHLEVVKYLVSNCADVDINATTQDGTTAFCWASWQCHLHIMRFLRDAGMNFYTVNANGHTALHKAAQRGSITACNGLLIRLCGMIRGG